MAKTLYEYYTGKGQSLPSVSARSADAKKAGISNYSGTASQNAQLLSYLQGSSSTKTTPKTAIQTPAPAGKVLGASTVASSVPTTQPLSKLEAMFGDDPEAQAKGSDYLMNNVYNKPSINDFRERQPDESITDYAKRLKNEPFYLAGYGDLPTERPKTLTANEVRAKAKQYGLEGTGFDFGALAGLTEGDVSSLLSEKSKNLKGSVSALTSFSLNNDYFSPISSAKKLFDAFNVGIKSATNPWNTEKDKKTSKNKLLEDTSLQLSQLFDSPATFDSFYTGNSEFKKLMDSFQKAGVSPDGVKSRIVTKTPDNATITDPLNPNESLYKEPATPKVSTDNTLLKGIADSTNQQIADLAGIPEQQREFYFGDTGYFTKIRQDAELQLQELDKSYKQIERDTEADYQANVKRAELQAEQQLAEIEESRVDAKNYMTGMLAKLGALKTTGEAPASLQRLETKYQAMANNTKTALFNAKATLASEKAKVISTIQSEKLGKMSAIRSDITKSSFEVQKELMNLENESKKQINALISDFNKESLDLDKTALAEANKLKLEYQKQFYKTASGGASYSTSGVNGDPSKLPSNLQAIYNNPQLLNNYTPTEKGKILNQLASAGLDLTRFGVEKLGQGQREQIDMFDTLNREAGNAKALLEKGLDTGQVASRGQEFSAKFLGGAQDYTTYRSVLDNLGSILIKARSGAAVTPQEFERIAGFIPNRYDDEKTAKTKIERFFTELEAAKSNYIKRATQSSYQISQEGNGGGASLNTVLGGASRSPSGTDFRSKYGY